MKAQDRSNYLIAAGVILCSAVLLAALTFALTGFSLRTGGRKLAIEFHDATGIKLHSDVRYAGKAAGAVSELRYLTAQERASAKDPANAIHAVVRLNDDVPPLLEGVSATLSAETLLGEKFIELMPGNPKARPLPDGAVIQGITVASIDSVAGAAKDAIDKVNDILGNVKTDYPSLITRLTDLLTKGSGILGQGSNLVNNVDSTILNANGAVTKLKGDYAELIPKLHSVLAEAQSIATNADHAVLKASSLIDNLDGVVKNNEADLKKLIEELRVTSQNLKVLTTYAKALTARLAEKPSSLIWSGKKRELPREKTILESSEPVSVEEKPDGD
jgi:phospholipid/cholesterol/gamma-HCH transport system substrate-binding protein